MRGCQREELEQPHANTSIHARHAWLLVWPLRLCAVWSGGDISAVNTLEDPRNRETAALYGALALCAALTFALPRRERAPWMMAWAMVVLFFLPASQVPPLPHPSVLPRVIIGPGVMCIVIRRI